MSLSKGYKFIYNTPEALIIQSLKLAIMSGIVLSSPVIFFNIWMFISPALKITEKVVITIIFTLGVVLFLVGCVFAYYIIIHNCKFFYSLWTCVWIASSFVMPWYSRNSKTKNFCKYEKICNSYYLYSVRYYYTTWCIFSYCYSNSNGYFIWIKSVYNVFIWKNNEKELKKHLYWICFQYRCFFYLFV